MVDLEEGDERERERERKIHCQCQVKESNLWKGDRERGERGRPAIVLLCSCSSTAGYWYGEEERKVLLFLKKCLSIRCKEIVFTAF